MTDQQLALLNGMTGKDAPKKTRKQAVTAQTNTNNAAALPKCLDSVTEGGLYFVSLEPSINEGDLRVGLARAVESKAIAEGQAHEDVKVLVKWYARNEWLGPNTRGGGVTGLASKLQRCQAHAMYGNLLSLYLASCPYVYNLHLQHSRREERTVPSYWRYARGSYAQSV